MRFLRCFLLLSFIITHAYAYYGYVDVVNEWTEHDCYAWDWVEDPSQPGYTYMDEGEEIVVSPGMILDCTWEVETRYQTVMIYAGGLNPACSYSINGRSVSGQSSFSAYETYDVSYGSPSMSVDISEFNCTDAATVEISGPSSVIVNQTASYSASISGGNGNNSITWSGGAASGSGGSSYSTYWSQPGTYTVTATLSNGANDSISVSVTRPSVSGVQAVDADHPGRVAVSGGTLYLVGEVSSVISATGWSNGCQWSNGQTSASFTSSSASIETFSVGDHSVTVDSILPDENSLTFGSLLGESSTTNLKHKLRFPGGASFSCDFVVGESGYNSEKVEKYNSPDWGWKRQLTLGASASISGRITHPQFSGSYSSWVIWELYAQAGIEIATAGGVELDPSTQQNTWQSYGINPSVDLTGTVEAGYYVYLDTSWVKIDGNLSASTSASAEARIEGAAVQTKYSWGGLNGNATLKIYRSDPNNPICDYSGAVSLIEGGSTDWATLFDL